MAVPLLTTYWNVAQHQHLEQDFYADTGSTATAKAQLQLKAALQLIQTHPDKALEMLTRVKSDGHVSPEQGKVVDDAIASLARSRIDDADIGADDDSKRPVCVPIAGSLLPTGRTSGMKTSVLTGQPIKGAAFVLEDESTCVGLQEAIQWASLNRFSPLNTGSRINPF